MFRNKNPKRLEFQAKDMSAALSHIRETYPNYDVSMIWYRWP